MIRYFCAVLPDAGGDVPYGYLEALSNVGRRLRAQPIGMANFQCDRRWWRAARLFQTPMRKPYVNVVCSRVGLPLGTAMPVSRLGPSQHMANGEEADSSEPLDAVERHLGKRAKSSSDIVYQPELALVGLHTVGCKNVAITYGVAGAEIDLREIHALGRYDLIITPYAADKERLEHDLASLERHVPVLHIQPRPDLLGRLLDDLCGSSTSATTRNSQASAAPRATTSPPSSKPGMRSRSSTGDRSRELPLRAEPSRQNLAIVTSTASSGIGHFLRHALSRLWRSITRSLGSWRRSG
jgi:hypothetical protein